MRNYDDLAERHKVYNADRSRAASFTYRDRDDHFDSDRVYDIALWDCRSRSLIRGYTRTHSVGAGGESGGLLVGLEFDADDALWALYQGGGKELLDEPPLRGGDP
jgi:hypothetical protein